MLIIAGLGNPGGKYAANRHNIGFLAADEIVRHHAFGPWKSKFKAEISTGMLDGDKALIVKPQTFMNNSGEAVGKLLRFYKLAVSDLVVIHDELDLVSGKVRIKTGGGAGGHNGIRSIDAHCGKDYRRLRLGIGHPGDKAQVTNHVLGDFARADYLWLDPLLATIADNAPLLAKGEEASFMNRVSLAMKSDDDKPVKGKSHIRQARSTTTKPATPARGAMAAMLKKLFGNQE